MCGYYRLNRLTMPLSRVVLARAVVAVFFISVLFFINVFLCISRLQRHRLGTFTFLLQALVLLSLAAPTLAHYVKRYNMWSNR